MFAEIFTDSSVRKFNAFMLVYDDEKMITTIPTFKDEHIFFLPNETIHISVPMQNNVYSFEANFNKFKKLNDNYFFSFDILHDSVSDNIRREKRIHTDNPAILKNSVDPNYSFANVLDSSRNGLRIETTEMINRRVLNISFQNGNSKESRRVKIAWSRKVGEKYHYGLQTIS